MLNSSVMFGMTWNEILPGFRTPLIAGVVSLIVTLLATPWVMKLAHKHGAVDDPTRDERRVHKTITPRWGGLAIFAGILVSAAVLLPFAYPYPATTFPLYLIGIFICSILLVIYGLWDDKVQLSAKIQLAVLLIVGFGVQVLGSKAVGYVQIQGVNLPWVEGNWVEFGIWSWPLTAIYIFVVTKTMDTIDGIDGLAAGIAAIASVTLAVVGTLEGQPRVALLAMAIAGACLGFLRFNYHPAKVFMGTAGAQLLGFLLASLSIVGAMKTAATVAVIVPMLIFGIPLFDAGFVVVRRLLSGQPISAPDKRHVHHTLMGTGLNQRQTVWVLYLIAICLSGLMLFLVRQYG